MVSIASAFEIVRALQAAGRLRPAQADVDERRHHRGDGRGQPARHQNEHEHSARVRERVEPAAYRLTIDAPITAWRELPTNITSHSTGAMPLPVWAIACATSAPVRRPATTRRRHQKQRGEDRGRRPEERDPAAGITEPEAGEAADS